MQDNGNIVDFLAWEWLLANTEAYAAVSRANGIVLNYDELAHDPEPKMRVLFAKLGLTWSDSTSRFLKQAASGDGSYYSLSRSAGAALSSWRGEGSACLLQRCRTRRTEPFGVRLGHYGQQWPVGTCCMTCPRKDRAG